MKETCSYVLFNYDSINNETLIFPTIKGNAVETSELPFWNKYYQYLAKDSYANLIATVTLIITLITFIIQTHYSNRSQKKTVKENWYLTVIVQPNLINIDNFYKEISDKLQNEIEKLKRSNSRNIILEKAKSNRKLQNIKNTFFIYFVTLIQSYNSSLANEVDAILNKLQDNSVTWIDQYNNISIDNCKRKIYENKSQLMGILYQDISQNKKNIQT